jgi:hypothetical protein
MSSPTESSRPVRTTRRLSIPWQRMAGLRRRLTQTIFAIAPLALMAIGVHPAIAVIPAIYPFFILIRRGYRRLRKHVTRAALGGEHGIRLLLGLLPLAICWAQGDTGVVGWITAILFALVPLPSPWSPASPRVASCAWRTCRGSPITAGRPSRSTWCWWSTCR